MPKDSEAFDLEILRKKARLPATAWQTLLALRNLGMRKSGGMLRSVAALVYGTACIFVC